jgi:hypothetical protein
MGRVLLIFLAAGFIAAGCGAVPPVRPTHPADQPGAERATMPRRSGDRLIVNDGAGEVEVQKMELRAGVSSATVERLAKAAGCNGTLGAGLVTERGPIEIYRMQCENGKPFMARCELRQCKPMR